MPRVVKSEGHESRAIEEAVQGGFGLLQEVVPDVEITLGISLAGIVSQRQVWPERFVVGSPGELPIAEQTLEIRGLEGDEGAVSELEAGPEQIGCADVGHGRSVPP